jgi:hypothetical protein
MTNPLFVEGAIALGAGEEIRTLDIHLGKVALYQLSYSRAPLSSYQLSSYQLEKTACNPERHPCQQHNSSSLPPAHSSLRNKKPPASTYSSRGETSSTIGVHAFHDPVRDGVGWDHVAINTGESQFVIAARDKGRWL